MDKDNGPPIRSLPRLFLPGVDPNEPIALPPSEVDKFRKVLRLKVGDQVAILPDDGTLVRCRFENHIVVPLETVEPNTEPSVEVVLLQAMPKPDRLETLVRMGVEIGVSKFVVFPAARSVVQWDSKKVGDKLRRLEAIIREAAEQSFRCRMPKIEWQASFAVTLKLFPDAFVLDESEKVARNLNEALNAYPSGKPICIAVGPEGGWDPRERAMFIDRGVTLGSRVLRTDTAAVVAAALALLK